MSAKRPSTIVISDWLANCRSGQWTPFEAAKALKEALLKERYMIVDLDAPANGNDADGNYHSRY